MTNHRILLFLLASAAAVAQPRLTQITHGASYEGTIAPGSIFVGFGTAIGPPAIQQAPSLPLTTTLAGTSIRFTPVSGGAPVDAFMVYALATQVSGILPSTAAPGSYNVTVTYNGQTSAPVRATVAARAFGMFTLTSSGTGPAVMQNAVSSSELVVNQFVAPARPGQTIILYGTGIGAVPVADNIAPGALDLRAAANVQVLVGGQAVTPVYAGRSPGFPGLDQINFVLPANVATGCTVPLQVRAGGVTTRKTVSIAVAPEGRQVCLHPYLSEDAVRRISAGGSFTVVSLVLAGFDLSSILPVIGPVNVLSEFFTAQMLRITLSDISRLEADNVASVLTVGTCVVYDVTSTTQGFDLTDPGGRVEQLDAGPALTLTGPGLGTRTAPKTRGGDYLLELVSGVPLPGAPPAQSVIAPGEYVATAPGGASVRAFTARTRVPARLRWTNRDAIQVIRRSQPLTITWDPGAADDLTLIAGAAGRNTTGNILNPLYETKTFFCTARASAGSFTIPVDVLQQLPQAPLDLTGSGSFGQLNVQFVPAWESGHFDATLADGTRVDTAVFRYALGSQKLLGVE